MRSLFIICFLLFVYRISAFGSATFYGEFTMTNKEYGSGAQFPCKVWFNANTAQMRIDYSNPQGTVFLREYYNYKGTERYSVCNSGKCTREQWTSVVPLFVGNSSTYALATGCVTPDWPGPRACPLTCTTYNAQPAQPNGFLSLSYTDATNFNLCLARWAPSSGDTYGREWHFTRYITAGFTSAQDPTLASTYQAVIDSATSPCPPAVCKTQIDIALVIDESGSIFQSSGWNDVQTFVRNFVGGLEMSADGTAARVGLVYFSGLGNCVQNWTYSNGVGKATDGCSSRDDCTKCGGRWQQLTTGVTSSKADVIAKINGNSGAGGYTCISCGLDVGIKILNVFPKANVQKLIVLMTDGEANRVTGSLATQAKIAYDQGTKIIAVGTGAYKIEDLRVFATTIYSTKSFNELSGIVNSIISSFCLPAPQDCNFCSGLCSCSTTCNCPDCNDYNACTVDRCDPRAPPDGTSGICVTVPLNCDDNNVCTQNLCNSATGCNFTQPTAKTQSQVDTFCKRWICTDPVGYQQTDVGSTVCVQPADRCIITYCSTTVGSTVVNGTTLTGSCVSINRTDPQYPVGTTINYVNSLGQNLQTSGCARPSNALPCEVYSCFNGSCTYSGSNCLCKKNSDCDDGDGCTTDVCDTNLNRCIRTPIDCWSNLSNGNCKTGVNTAQTTATGDSFYMGTGSFPVDANGLPTPNTGVTRTCDNLACYGGIRSQYTCFSNSNTTFTCRRQTNPCTSSSCSDNTCRSLGTWSSNQMTTDCLKSIARTCNDGNACTTDSCNSTWTGTSCQSSGTCATTTGGNRCIFQDISQNCNDNSVCTTDTCNTATGCVFTTRPLPPSNFCFNVGCDAKTGNFSNVNTARCTASSDKCIINYCNTTSQVCVSHNKSSIALGSIVTFVDQYGVLQTVTGCFKAAIPGVDCRAYTCNSTTGLCVIDATGCSCTYGNDVTCDDNNGCTVDKCLLNGKCENTPIDCWSELSNGGGCSVNLAGLTVNNATGVTNYNAGSPNNQFQAGVYNCDQLACYSGQRSQYTCVSQSNATHTCRRDTTPCAKGGCLDTICTSLGTWTNGQLDTDCSSSIPTICTSDACTISKCNEAFVYGTTAPRCLTTSNASNCDDNNACTQNLCNSVSGCYYTTLVPNPFGPNKTCVGYACDATTGWQAYDLGISQCTNLPANPCQLTYCNTTLDRCVRLDKSDLKLGQNVDYIDSAGVLRSLSGCANPGDPLVCKLYTCDSTNGQCTTSIAGCKCIDDSSCSDGDGCTVDRCNISANACERTVVDCFSILSNGSCTQGSSFAGDIMTGLNLYYNNASNPNNFTAVDANGLPSPSTGVRRTCGELGCYNGQPSQYSCFSAQEGSYSCQRISVNCSRNGCQDNICRTNGTWSNGQINSDCGTIYRPFCADNNACTDDFCNSTWVPSAPVDQRCIHTPINATKVCDDGNFCTFDFCDTSDASGDICRHSLYDTKVLKQKICTNVTSVCQTVQCTVNKCVYGEVVCLPPTLCIFHICNATTKGVCKQYPSGIYKFDKCGVCGGNGFSCVPNNPGNPKKTSIAVALGVGLGVGLAAAAIIIFILSKKSYDYYSALATETLGTVTTAPTYQGGEHHFDTSGYGGNQN